MKKMRRFLSLLICMVMLMSFLPMSASAARISTVTVNFARPSAGDPVEIGAEDITLIGARYQSTGHPHYLTIAPTIDKNHSTYRAGESYVITLKVRPNSGDSFRNSLSVSAGTDVTATISQRNGDNVTITLSFIIPVPHSHNANIDVPAVPKSCTTNGVEAYKKCECDEYFVDMEGNEIPDLESWKQTDGAGKIPAGHEYGDLIPEDPAVHEQDTLEAGMEAHYICGKCGAYADAEKNPVDSQNDLIIPEPQHTPGSWEVNSTQHWKVCTFCGKEQDRDDHEFGNDNTCDVCLYTKQIHTVKFDIVNWGYDPQNQYVEAGNAVVEPVVPNGGGYTLDGWYTDRECTQKYDFENSSVTAPITLYAKWVAKTYKVTFSGENATALVNNATVTEVTDIAHGGRVFFMVTPADGYRVTAVKVGRDTLTPNSGVYTISDIYENKEVVISTEAIEYEIEYVLGGGELPETAPKTYTVESEVTLVAPTREGFKFAGWTGEGIETPIEEVSFKDRAKDSKYTAHWLEKFDVIFYDPNGEVLETKTVVEKDYVTATTETVTGYYDPTAWYTDTALQNEFDFDNTPITEDVELYADWTLIPELTGISIEPGEAAAKPGATVTFTVKYTGVGEYDETVKWFVAPETELMLLSDEETATIDQEGNLKLPANAKGKYIVTVTTEGNRTNAKLSATATVTVTPYKVEFNMHEHGTQQVEKQEIAAGGKVTKPADPIDSGYAFGGWYLDEKFETPYDFNAPVNEDLVLHAKWTKYVKVSYDHGDGTGTMEGATLLKGADYTLLENGFTAPKGKVFKCWRVDGKDYKPGEMIKVNEDTTVVAKWTTKTVASDLDYVPAAGDNFPTFLWAGLLLFSVIALAEVVSIRRKRS